MAVRKLSKTWTSIMDDRITCARSLRPKNRQRLLDHRLAFQDADWWRYHLLPAAFEGVVPDQPLVMMSPRAMQSFVTYLSEGSSQGSYPWSVYTVGQNSSKKLEAMNVPVHYTASNAQELASVLVAQAQSNTKYQICSTEWRTPFVEDVLKQNQIDFSIFLVYEKLQNLDQLPQSTRYAIFSYSHLDLLLQQYPDCPKETVFYCIGEKTANYVRSFNFERVYHPSRTGEDELVELIIKHEAK